MNFNIGVMFETDEAISRNIKTPDELAKAILEAWNYEEGVYLQDGTTIFYPIETMENNHEWLCKYGLGVKEVDGYYRIYNRSNEKVYKADWEH